MPEFEEEYEDVLQNIEFAIVSVYREDVELLDYDVEKALNALMLVYQAERQARQRDFLGRRAPTDGETAPLDVPCRAKHPRHRPISQPSRNAGALAPTSIVDSLKWH